MLSNAAKFQVMLSGKSNMSDTRKIVGCIDVPPKKDHAFPSVRIWIDSPKGFQTHGFRELFPDRGTVYLHVSACNGRPLVTNQIGLFNCQQPEVPGRPWKVSSTLTSLARVIHFPLWERVSANLALWDWLNTYKDKVNCNILLGDGTVYVQLDKNQVIGPLSLLPDGKLTIQRQVHRYKDVKIIEIHLGRQEIKLVDTSLLSIGHPVILNPKDAIQRRLKLANDANEFRWLSREKKQELSAALAEIKDEDGSEWVMECLPRALEALGSSKQIDEKLVEEILKISTVSAAIETEWKKKNTRIVSENEQEIKMLKDTASNLKQPIDTLRKELASINIEKAKLDKDLVILSNKVDATKADAQKAFDLELKRLAQSPASVALFSAWIGCSSNSNERGRPIIRIQRQESAVIQAKDLKSSLFSNFKMYGLCPLVSKELATVCIAALAAGQPVSFKSLYGDLLAEVFAASIGYMTYTFAEIPAGLLDPLNWGEIISPEQESVPLILQNVNRSSISIVLGSMRRVIYEQAAGCRKSSTMVIMTHEPTDRRKTTSEPVIGPLIDDTVLRINQWQATSLVNSFSDYAKELPTLSHEITEDITHLGDSLTRLSAYALPSNQIVFRRAYSALLATCEDSKDVIRLFFKYWCMARSSPDEIKTLLEAYKESWNQDKTIVNLASSLERNE